LGSSEIQRLPERARVSGGTVAWGRTGHGPPLVLVHGTPSWSYAWRRVTAELARSFTVYRFDLLGYGDSEQAGGQDVSIAAQAVYLGELLDLWELEQPAVAGHDIGGAIVLRAHLCEGRAFGSISLVDAVVFNPWTTLTTTHIRRHLHAYRTMPGHIYEQVVRAHLRTAMASEPAREVLEAYLRPWLGATGQEAYFRKLEQIDERQTAVLEPRLGEVDAPVQVIWGERDAWLAPELAQRLAAAIPGAKVRLVPGAGHFAMEDDPEAVASLLRGHAGLVSPRV
jgi:pimeloyl-ACP methyl ester carboxylesterase